MFFFAFFNFSEHMNLNISFSLTRFPSINFFSITPFFVYNFLILYLSTLSSNAYLLWLVIFFSPMNLRQHPGVYYRNILSPIVYFGGPMV